MAIGTNHVVHIAFVVKDIEKVVDNWSKILGLSERPRIWNIPGPDVAPTLTNGELEIYKNCIISVITLDNIVLEIVQPGDEPSPWKTYLSEHGEGFQHMSFLVPDEEEAVRTIKEVCKVDSHYHEGYYPGQVYRFYNTFDALKTELNIKVDGDYTKKIKELQKQV